MVSYELAQELKMEGYPQDNSEGAFYAIDGLIYSIHQDYPTGEVFFIPTLDHFVHILGKTLYQLEQVHETQWVARSKDLIEGHGTNPREALAYLYLAERKYGKRTDTNI